MAVNHEILQMLEIRPLYPDDDLKQVAALIYSSDNYIYPYLFDDNLAAAKEVLANMILADTIYNFKNIRVAIVSGQIVAMIVLKEVPVKADHEAMLDCFVKAGEPVGARFARVYAEYFKLLEEEQPDVYVANLAVDKMFRGAGVGKALFRSVLQDGVTYHLEVVKANAPAVALYRKLGFEIDCEYPGFTEIPCYRMTRAKKESKD